LLAEIENWIIDKENLTIALKIKEINQHNAFWIIYFTRFKIKGFSVNGRPFLFVKENFCKFV